jgi:hypothetical protein
LENETVSKTLIAVETGRNPSPNNRATTPAPAQEAHSVLSLK